MRRGLEIMETSGISQLFFKQMFIPPVLWTRQCFTGCRDNREPGRRPPSPEVRTLVTNSSNG